MGHGEVHGKRSKTTIAGEAEGGVLVEHLIVTWTLGNYGAVGNKKGYLQSNVNFAKSLLAIENLSTICSNRQRI